MLPTYMVFDKKPSFKIRLGQRNEASEQLKIAEVVELLNSLNYFNPFNPLTY